MNKEELPEELVQEEPEELNLSELQKLREEIQECNEKYLRLLAESENARKRMQKERQQLTQYAVENILVEFLHPLDNFSQALSFAESMSEEVSNWAQGFEMISQQFKQVLASHGVSEYSSLHQLFDPHFHEAVEMIETNKHPPGYIVEESLKGYKMGDRPIRVARVKVAQAPKKEENNLTT